MARRVTSCLAAVLATVLLAVPAHADFHLWFPAEFYTNADGSIQFIELMSTDPGQEFLLNHQLQSSHNGDTRTYIFPSNSQAPTNNRRLLLATQGFADLPGMPIPDYIIPDDFLHYPDGTLTLVGAWTENYTGLPTDGTNALHFPGPTSGANSPTNFAGVQGQVVLAQPIADPLPDVPLGDVVVELEVVLDGLNSPLGMTTPDDGTDRLFIYDQTGQVHVVQDGLPLPTPLIDVSARLVPLGAGYDERGLLGMALYPEFATNGRFYLYTSEPVAGAADFTNTAGTQNHQTVIAEWTMTGGDPSAHTADPASRREILRIDQPQSNHNGGTIRFGPDGFLYIALGDGGMADDQGPGHVEGGNAQDTSNVYGSILRIDVDGQAGSPSANGQYSIPPDNPFAGGDGLDEIFVHGLRNPFQFSFDMGLFTPDGWRMYVADAGQNDIEEVTRLTPADAGGNLGWPLKEGSFYFDQNGGDAGRVVTAPVREIPPGLIDPLVEYDHDDGVVDVGGFVYRGAALPELVGRYVFAEFGTQFGSPSGRLWYVNADDELRELRIGDPLRPLGYWVKGFGQDLHGEVYVMGSQRLGPGGGEGVVLRLRRPTADVPNRLVWPRGTQDFSDLPPTEPADTIAGWTLTGGGPAFSVRAVDTAPSPGPETPWLRIVDVDGAGDNQLATPWVRPPADPDFYSWTMVINQLDTPPAGDNVPMLAVQHEETGGGVATVWGIELRANGGWLVVADAGGTPGEVRLFELNGDTAVGQWITVELSVNFQLGQIDAAANGGVPVNLPIAPAGDLARNAFRLAYLGGGTDNVMRLLLDDVSIDQGLAVPVVMDAFVIE